MPIIVCHQNGGHPVSRHVGVPPGRVVLHPLHVRHPARRLRLRTSQPAAGAQPQDLRQDRHLLPRAHHPQRLRGRHEGLQTLRKGAIRFMQLFLFLSLTLKSDG